MSKRNKRSAVKENSEEARPSTGDGEGQFLGLIKQGVCGGIKVCGLSLNRNRYAKSKGYAQTGWGTRRQK